ncbi:MAG: ABC transporter substrate-binding protein [Betaproteobacteria bacterium]|nr:MAG: ABC transporter substrate-binding protein [Betaproteobacteria bacterium]
MSAQIRVLSAGAVKTGVRAAADAFEGQGMGEVALRFATAPTIRTDVSQGALADVVILPSGGMNELATLGKVNAASRIMLGRVGAGVAVRDGAPVPDITSVESLKQALFDADSIAYNKASTGLYIETLFERLGIAAALAPKIARKDNGAAVMNHLLEHRGRDIGFGAATEILVFVDKGVRLVGPLPTAIQNYTRYEAAVMAAAADASAAGDFVAFLASEPGRALLRACGVEEAPADPK